jgi:hypothetical protein
MRLRRTTKDENVVAVGDKGRKGMVL